MVKKSEKDTEMERLADPLADPMAARRSYTADLAAVAAKCGPTVQKEGAKTGAGGSYKFVGHEHVVKATDGALSAAGFVVEAPCAFHGPTVLDVTGWKDGRQTTRQIWLWTVSIPVSHQDGHREVYEIACTTAANDKASYVASTAADRTLRLRLCGLAGSKDENPEHDTNDAQEVPHSAPESRVVRDEPPKAPKARQGDTSSGESAAKAAARAQFVTYCDSMGMKPTPKFVKAFCLEHSGEQWDNSLSDKGAAAVVDALKGMMETGEVAGGF